MIIGDGMDTILRLEDAFWESLGKVTLGDKETIEDWHDLEKEIGVWGFSLERETIKKKKKDYQFGFGGIIRWCV